MITRSQAGRLTSWNLVNDAVGAEFTGIVPRRFYYLHIDKLKNSVVQGGNNAVFEFTQNGVVVSNALVNRATAVLNNGTGTTSAPASQILLQDSSMTNADPTEFTTGWIKFWWNGSHGQIESLLHFDDQGTNPGPRHISARVLNGPINGCKIHRNGHNIDLVAALYRSQTPF